MKRHRLRRGSRDHLTQRYTMPLPPTKATTTLAVGRCASEAPAPPISCFSPSMSLCTFAYVSAVYSTVQHRQPATPYRTVGLAHRHGPCGGSAARSNSTSAPPWPLAFRRPDSTSAIVRRSVPAGASCYETR
jgi:hypothetical protein